MTSAPQPNLTLTSATVTKAKGQLTDKIVVTNTGGVSVPSFQVQVTDNGKQVALLSAGPLANGASLTLSATWKPTTGSHTVVTTVDPTNAVDRGDEGVVVTGVTDLPFQDVLDALNGPAQDAGFKVTSGETEEHDAEANWSGNGYRGRWGIRESADCPGETVVQVLSAGE